MQDSGDRAHAVRQIAQHSNWYHQIEVAPGVVTAGVNDSSAVLERLPLPANLSGTRVLDLGTRDGFFAFECERRGADVVAVDSAPVESTGFAIAARLLGSRIVYVQDNIYRLTPRRYGLFDAVLMLGLLYHLPDPLGALEIVRKLCRDRLYLETHVCDEDLPAIAGQSIAQFRPDSAPSADPTNYWIPNVTCVHALLATASFTLDATSRTGNRAIFVAKPTVDPTAFFMGRLARGKHFVVGGPHGLPGRRRYYRRRPGAL